MPEIREQAYDVARAVVRALHGETRRRPTDAYGLTLTTGRRAAAAYNEALGRLLRLQDGVEVGLERGRRARPRLRPGARRPGPARPRVGGHRLLAQLAARRPRGRRRPPPRRPRGQLPRRRHHPAAVRRGHRRRGPAAPRAAVPARRARRQRRRARRSRSAASPRAARPPTSSRAWAAPTATTGGTPASWPSSARTRSAGPRPRSSRRTPSSVEPASGHAVHARAHVFYETGEHVVGLAWLDEWIRTCGREANHRSHFSWHAALHELMQGDVEAVRRRYERELAPPRSPAHAPWSTAPRCCGAAGSPTPGRSTLPERGRSAARPPTAG